MKDRARAARILRRYAPDAEAGMLDDLLNDHAVVIAGAATSATYFDPYSAALEYVTLPDTVKARTQGGVSETYIDPQIVADQLRRESAALRASWPAPAALAGEGSAPNVDLILKGWGG